MIKIILKTIKWTSLFLFAGLCGWLCTAAISSIITEEKMTPVQRTQHYINHIIGDLRMAESGNMIEFTNNSVMVVVSVQNNILTLRGPDGMTNRDMASVAYSYRRMVNDGHMGMDYDYLCRCFAKQFYSTNTAE
jgi:hypothetical protein